ncbi:MAG: Flp pilus assembly complex ATPase component TadA, partial [Nitrospirae bacterium]|nr:Flp pilus assembly complex ATPase component TadA [Nitrospirota bacterium]
MDYIQNINKILLKSGLITESQLKMAIVEQSKTGMSLLDAVLSQGYISKEVLLAGVSSYLGIKYLRFNDFPKEIPSDNYPALSFLKQYSIVPIGKIDNQYMIAMADPTDVYAKDALDIFFTRKYIIFLSSSEDIKEAITHYFESSTDSTKLMEGLNEGGAEIIDDGFEEDVHQLRDMSHEAPIIKLINMFITKAVELHASDIHVETGEKQLTVRYRIDGILIEAETYPKKHQSTIISRIKIMSKMNISEKRLPQDGRIRLRVSGREIDLRVSTLPTLYGESVVMRILDRGITAIRMEEMGFCRDVLEQINKLITMPNGMFLVTGPT